MGKAHLLDKLIGDAFPDLSTPEKVRTFEQIPFRDRIAAKSTYEALQLGAAHNPAAPAMHFLPNAEVADEGVTLTHAQFLGRVTQAANMFTDLGVGPKDVVSFLLPLVPQAFFTLYGAEAAGVANPVNPLLEPGQIAEILRAAGTKVLVALGPVPGTDIWQKVEKVRGELPNLTHILQVMGPGDPQGNIHSFDTLIAKYPADKLTSGRKIEPDEVAGLFHTGGTTGTPKLVRHTHENQVSQAWVVNLMLRTQPGSPILFGLPLFHVGGALTQGLTTFAGGGAVVILSPSGWRNPNAIKNVWRLIERFKPSVFGAVPTIVAAALNVPVGGADISSLRVSSAGASSVPVAVGKQWEELTKTRVHEVYGMTETSGVHTISFQDRPVRLGAVGHSVPYARTRVVKLDPNGKYLGDCKVNEIGVVAMAGPGVFSGYVNAKHNKEAFVEPGWVNSGDLGRLDEDGYLWITGRAKDVIIRGGHNIDPLPIEEILFQHPAVGLAAVVGQPDPHAGELPVAYVQLKPDSKTDPAELLEFIRARTPERAAVPVNLYPVAPMPLTAVGKVFKPDLRWDAARRVFANALANLTNQGVDLSIHVGAHAAHGTVATVTIKGVPEAARGSIEQQVRDRLNPFAMRHEVKWG